MLVTNPAARASLTEVLEHSWMIRGFNGPPDSHLVHREPLRVDELDRQVIRGMKGFEFGSEEEIECKLVAILESEIYIRAVAAWDRKRGRNGGRWGKSFPNSSPSRSMDGLTPSKKSKCFSGFDFYRRKLFSPSSSPLTTPSHSPPNSQSHLLIVDTGHEPMDPVRGFHPLISMYYLAREKFEHERVYGPDHFASSQISIQSGAVPNATAIDENSAPNAYNAKAQLQPAKPQQLATPASAKADYSMPLPRLPALETSHYSGMSYDVAPATPSPTAVAFHGQPRARGVGLPPLPPRPPPTKCVDIAATLTTPTTPLPSAPPVSTHRRSHSLSQRPTVLRGLGGMFGGTEKPVDEAAEDIQVPHTAGPELGEFGAAKARVAGEDEGGVHDGPLSTCATLVRRFGRLLGGAGRGDDTKRRQGSIGKRTTIMVGVPVKAATDTEAEKRPRAVDVLDEKTGMEPEAGRQSTYAPPPLSASQSQPLSHSHRRVVTVLDPQDRAMRHERRSSTGGALFPSIGGSIGRHRRPSTGYGTNSARPVAVGQFGCTEEVEENAEHETSDSRAESFRNTSHVDKDFKPVHPKGLFSISTTSMKPSSVLNADIKKVLDRMQVQYRATKSGFECIHIASIDISFVPENAQTHPSHHRRRGSSGSNETCKARSLVKKASKLSLAAPRCKGVESRPLCMTNLPPYSIRSKSRVQN
ncbi:hypothetical protein JVU11DRAFT_1115 [Chiua virens]|nr:hypothetical protein JVU11DRAFT_1115 [Chiua virens]